MAAGDFLSAFADQVLRSRALAEGRNRAAAVEARDVFSTEHYLQELGREREVEEQTIPELIAAQRLRWAPQTRLPAPPSATYEGLPNPEAPEAPPAPVAAGGLAALMQPPRPAMAQTLLGGLTPQKAARVLTSRTGRAVLPTLEASERERRQDEDRQEAEALFGQSSALLRQDPASLDGLDLRAAAFRRLGRPPEANYWMQVSAKTRADAQETERWTKDMHGLNAALAAHDKEPTPTTLGAIKAAVATLTSLGGKRLAAEQVDQRLKHALSPDRDEEGFLRTFMEAPKEMPEEQAWKEAATRFPQGLFKFAIQELRSGKAVLPDSIWDSMRLKRPLGLKDFSLRGAAHQKTLLDSAAAARAGTPWDPPSVLNRFVANLNEMQKQETEAKRTPEAKAIEEHRAAILKIRREAMEKPESLDTKTSNELTILIQRTARDLDAIVDPQERQDAEAYLKLLREARDRKAGVGRPKAASSVDLQAEYNRLRKRGLTPEKARADLKRRGLLD